MKKYRWIIFGLSLLFFLIISYLVSNNVTTTFDMNIYRLITFSKNNIFTDFLKIFTFIGGRYGVLTVIILSFIFLKNKKYSTCIFLDSFFVVIINFAVKSLFMRDRPIELMMIEEDGYSFPSGHSMLAMGFYGFFIYLIWKGSYSKRFKIISTIVLSILILLIGISRIYLGVHFPTDVIAGYCLSLAFLMLYTYILEKRNIL